MARGMFRGEANTGNFLRKREINGPLRRFRRRCEGIEVNIIEWIDLA
jgi:hypothetical protein